MHAQYLANVEMGWVGVMQDPVIWQKVEWRQGDGRYYFEVQQGGLHATLTAPHGGSLTIPTVAWYALLDALTASRKTTERAERAFPARAGARWGEAEVHQLVDEFRSGKTINTLAKQHNRSIWAIETQLAQQGLWDRSLRIPAGQSGSDPGAAHPSAAASVAAGAEACAAGAPWPDDDWASLAASAAERPLYRPYATVNSTQSLEPMPIGHNLRSG